MAEPDKWTEAHVPDQAGRVVVITGANSGIGYEGTRILAGAGATVVMACRDLSRGERARSRILETVPGATLEVRECDLADLDSIAAFADAVLATHDRIDVLCNNAGVMAIPRRETADSFEYQFGVNHLGHFALTGHLIDRLRSTGGPARVVTQSSGMHARGDINFDDLQSTEGYGKWAAYAQSKLANLLFAYELDRRLDAAGAPVVSLGCHPGYAATNLQRRGPEMSGATLRGWAMRLANVLFAQSAARGALPMCYAATAASVDGGEYIGPDGFLASRSYPERQRSSKRSYDKPTARRLWDVSASLTGVRYGLPAPSDGVG